MSSLELKTERTFQDFDFTVSYNGIRKMEYIEGLTNLFSTIGIANPFVCKCGDGNYWQEECFCEKETPKNIVVEVRAFGEPIQTNPSETKYNVKIYTDYDPKKNEPIYDDNDEIRFSLLYDFTISESLDNTSLDHRQMIFYIFMGKESERQIPSKEFYGKKGRDSYISAFFSLAQKLLNPETKSRSDQPEENAHVSTKKKRK